VHQTNISDRSVNLPNNYAIALAEPYAGPTYEIMTDDQPADVGAEPLSEAGVTEDQPRTETPFVPVEAQAKKTNGVLRGLVSPDPKPPKPAPSPAVAIALIPPDLHPAIQRLMDRYKALWSEKLEAIDVTPQEIPLHHGTLPMRSQTDRTSFHHRCLLADHVEKQLQVRVIAPSQSEWSRPVVMVTELDGRPRFCVDYRRLNDVSVNNKCPLPRMDDC